MVAVINLSQTCIWVFCERGQDLVDLKKEVEQEDCNLFQGSGINITTARRPYLGALLGNDAFIKDLVCSKVKLRSSVIEFLTEAAAS